MKSIQLVAIITLLVSYVNCQGIATCLYCKRVDTDAGFLYSYSYCPDLEEEVCQQDPWNYIGAGLQCAGTMKPGYMLHIDEDCGATDQGGNCQDFDGDEIFNGQYSNRSFTLQPGEKCSVTVDASNATSRVIFGGSTDLGVLHPYYTMGQPITVDFGQVKQFTVYNGNSDGNIEFDLSFSSAMKLSIVGLVSIATAFAQTVF